MSDDKQQQPNQPKSVMPRKPHFVYSTQDTDNKELPQADNKGDDNVCPHGNSSSRDGSDDIENYPEYQKIIQQYVDIHEAIDYLCELVKHGHTITDTDIQTVYEEFGDVLDALQAMSIITSKS